MKLQKRLASEVLKCSPKRVVFDTEKFAEIKEAITRRDISDLVQKGTITKVPARGISRFRARKRAEQKRKGRQRGPGSKEGTHKARTGLKLQWIRTIRAQRSYLNYLRDKKQIDKPAFRLLSKKAKGGFFRSTAHIKLYLKEQELTKKGLT